MLILVFKSHSIIGVRLHISSVLFVPEERTILMINDYLLSAKVPTRLK